jgi:ribosomal protein S18 acetylase RimI-like enzyme
MLIRDAIPADAETIIDLMRDFAVFEELTEYFEATPQNLTAVMFGDGAFVKGLVVEDDGEVVAYSLFYPNYATFRGQKGIYLEDLYISKNHRGRGIGEAVIRRIAQIAKSQGCSRIDFQVLEWNRPAIGFYEKLGAERDETERHFRFTDAAFEGLAN